MARQPVMNGVIPFPPVFSKITCIPPICIESSVGESGQFSAHVGPSMEEPIEQSQPNVCAGCGKCYDASKDHQIISLLEMNERLAALGHDMLCKRIGHDEQRYQMLE